MEISRYIGYDEAEILQLYSSVGWTSYTELPEMLKKAFEGSLAVLAAYESGRLAGIIRLVGDGVSIVYIQDLLVHPEYQRRGIGSQLIREALRLYPDIYQTVLMTDDTEKTKSFYTSNGFLDASDMNISGFIRIHRKD